VFGILLICNNNSCEPANKKQKQVIITDVATIVVYLGRGDRHVGRYVGINMFCLVGL
jgi:hypothetical protein